jgi:hypothetical protein
MASEPATGGDNFPFYPVRSVPAVFRDKPPDSVEIFYGMRRELK